MNWLFIFLLCIVVCAGSAAAYALPAGHQRFADQCIRTILECRYEDALRLTDSAIAADPGNPLAPLLRLAALGIRDVDFDMLLDSSAFLATYKSAETAIDAYEKQNGVSSYSLTLKGFCRAIHSSFHLRMEAYYAALDKGFDALRLLGAAHEKDTGNADALLFLGLYDYARGELKRRLWWVLFWYPGSKDEGIRRLWTCVRSGHLSADAALFAIADIYVREKQPDACGPVVDRLERAFPKSRFVLWAKAKYFESRRLYYEAGLAYELLASSYAACPTGRHGMLVTQNLQAHMLARSGQKKDAAALCRAILRTRGAAANDRALYRDTEKLMRRLDGR